MIFKVRRMYRKFVSNSHKQCEFTNIIFVQVLTLCNIMIYNKQELIGPVFNDRQNDRTRAEDFIMKYFMWLYVRSLALSVHDMKIYRMKQNCPIELSCNHIP